MNRSHYRHLISHCLPILLGISLSSGASPTTPASPALPAWQALEFEQQAFWATARSRIEITPLPGDEPHWQLSSDSSVTNNSEQVHLTFCSEDGRLLQRTRLSQGKDRRYKSFDYLPDHIERVRRVPGNNADQAPREWPVSSQQQIPYPELAADQVITNAYLLLLLADRFQAGTDESTQAIIHTDFNFYQVTMTHSAGTALEVDYQVNGGQQVTGLRDTHGVTLEVNPLGTLAEKPDFSLLGLHGRITLLYETETGVLVQLRGTAPRLGPAEINLKSVTLRTPQG